MTQNVLSSRQFAESLKDPEIGGGSRRFSDKTTADEGYFVSRDRKRTIPEGGSDEERISAQKSSGELAEHLEATWKSQRGPAMAASADPEEVYQGGWTHAGKHYTDVSDRYENSPKGLHEAMRASESRGQLAAFALHSFNELGALSEDKSTFDNKDWVREGKEQYGTFVTREKRPRVDNPSDPQERRRASRRGVMKTKRAARKNGA